MIKKLAIVLSFSIILTTLANVACAANTTSNDAYAAYYEFLEDRIAAVGYIKPSTLETTGSTHEICEFYPKNVGVFFAQLIDFDKNGTDELFLIESVRDEKPVYDNYYFYYLRWYVYSYTNRNMVLLKSDSIRKGYFGFTKDKNGITYYYEGEGQYDWDDFTFWSLKNGCFTESSVTLSWIPDWSFSGTINGQHVSGSSNTSHGDGSGLISSNGKVTYISAKEIAGLRKKIISGGQQLYDYNNRPSDQAVQALMNQIETKYLPNYHTPSTWARDIVTQAVSCDVVPKSLQRGYQRPITRLEFCSLATKFYESTTKSIITERAQFKDTSDINVRKMGGLGIVSGVGNGNFEPNGLLTREAAAVILIRLSSALGIDINTSSPNFIDKNDISLWAYDQVGKAQAAGLMSGVGNNTFSPKSTYTREQSIATIMRMMDIQHEVNSLEFNEDNLRLLVGGSKTVVPTIGAENGANKTLKWSSSDSRIASVDQLGCITANGAGIATITATANNGISASCTVTVIKPDGQIYSECPVTLKCLALPSYMPSDPDIHYVPENAEPGGTIQITDIIEEKTLFGVQVNISGKIKSIEPGIEYFTPYVKWILENKNGQTVASGMKYASRYKKYQPGDEFKLSISLHWGISGAGNFKKDGYYSIRFIED